MQQFLSFEFVALKFDHWILIHKTEAFFITIYMDDVTLCGPGSAIIKNVKNTLISEFEATHLADLHWWLWIQNKFGSNPID
jgi:hypothetical protein